MSAGVRALLQQCAQGKGPDDYVLTREGKRAIVDMRDAWWNLCVRAGLGKFVCPEEHTVAKRKPCPECGSRKREYRGLIPHDLRRSAAKALRRAGVPESVIMIRADGGRRRCSAATAS